MGSADKAAGHRLWACAGSQVGQGWGRINDTAACLGLTSLSPAFSLILPLSLRSHTALAFFPLFIETAFACVIEWPLLSWMLSWMLFKSRRKKAELEWTLPFASSNEWLMSGCCTRPPAAMSFPVRYIPKWEHVWHHSHGCLTVEPWEVCRKQSSCGMVIMHV